MNRRSDDDDERRPEVEREGRHAQLKRVAWFVLLWCFGVAGTALLALPFHWLVVSAIRHPG
jgi:hypothetical protein